MENLKEIFAYIDEHQEEYLKELADYVSIRSVAGDTEGLDAARNYLLQRMEKSSLAPALVPVENGNAMIRAGKKGENEYTVLFYNHYDVVQEGDPEKWESKAPYTLTRVGDTLYARGVSDDKGPLLTRLQALDAILKIKGKLPVNVKFLLEGDEESTSPSMFKFLSEQPDTFKDITASDICIWENGRRDKAGNPWARFGMKGACGLDLSVTTAKKDVHGSQGSALPSASWRLIWAIASMKDSNENITIDGFYDDIAPVTDADLAVLDKLPYEEGRIRKSMELRGFLHDASGLELKKNLYMKPSFTVSGLEAGEMYKGPRGIVPHTASARLSFYLVPNQSPERIRDLVRKHLDAHSFSDVEVKAAGKAYPVRTPVTIKERKALEEAAQLVYGKSLVIEPTQLGAGPAIAVRRVWPELPVVGIGPGNNDGNHHAPNENLKVDDYMKAIKYVVAFLYGLTEIA